MYSKGAHWEKQGLNPGFNFFLCLREKEVFFFFFLSFFFFPFFFFVSNVPIGFWAKLSQKKSEEKDRKKGL